ncbi:MAG: transcription/translation regulatory transformer protein RfaH [Thioalkalispiraceae bacterium]|jgi:transcriptional antiterminator RfaH
MADNPEKRRSNLKSWYLVYTKARGEDLARKNLNRQGFITFLPLLKRNKRVNGRYQPIIEALFPRYLFILLDTENDNWMPIRSTVGVSNMVKFGSMPARVPQDLVDELQHYTNEEGIRCLPERKMKCGDEIEFIEGALSGYRALFEKYVSTERISVLLDIVGKHTRMLVSKHDIQLAS